MEDYTYAWTCPECGCHVYEGDGMTWLENKVICTNCKVVNEKTK